MVALILGMLICVGLALAVVALVAVPARRDGRGVLTPKGEEVVIALKERQQSTRQRLERGEEGPDASGPDPARPDVAGADQGPVREHDVATTPADAGARS